MRIIRFIDDTDTLRFGLESNGDQVEVLTGDLYTGLTPSGESVTMKKLLAPITPSNIYCIGLTIIKLQYKSSKTW